MTLNTHDIAIDSQRIRPGLEEKTSNFNKFQPTDSEL
jgi:hypothetical protein